MNGDLPSSGGGSAPSAYDLAMWRAAGLFACMFNGKMGRFSYYQAQAIVESGESFNTTWFREGHNAFGMHASEYTPRADVSVAGDGGSMAIYTAHGPVDSFLRLTLIFAWLPGFLAYYRSWKDRFYWDDTFVNDGVQSVEQWAQDVADHGYMGGANATRQERDAYATRIVAVYNNSPNVVGKVFDDNAGPVGRFMRWVMILIMLGVIALLLYWAYNLYKWIRRLMARVSVGRRVRKARKRKKR